MSYYVKHIITIKGDGNNSKNLKRLAQAIKECTDFQFKVYEDHLDDYNYNGGAGISYPPMIDDWEDVAAKVNDLEFTVHCFSENHAIYDYECCGGIVNETMYRRCDEWYKEYEKHPELKSLGANQNYYKDFGYGETYPVLYGGTEKIPAGVEWWKLDPVFLDHAPTVLESDEDRKEKYTQRLNEELDFLNKNCLVHSLLRKPGVSYEMDGKQEGIYMKCQADPVYFGEKYCVRGKLSESQKRLLQIETTNNLLFQERQCGLTTALAIRCIYKALFQNQKVCLLRLSHQYGMMIELMEKIKTLLPQVPFFLQKGVHTFNSAVIKFEDGSGIFTKAVALNHVDPDESYFIGRPTFYKTLGEKPFESIRSFIENEYKPLAGWLSKNDGKIFIMDILDMENMYKAMPTAEMLKDFQWNEFYHDDLKRIVNDLTF